MNFCNKNNTDSRGSATMSLNKISKDTFYFSLFSFTFALFYFYRFLFLFLCLATIFLSFIFPRLNVGYFSFSIKTFLILDQYKGTQFLYPILRYDKLKDIFS